MRSVELSVLVHEGPQARAYLARMRRAGLRPRRVVLMVSARRPASGRPVGRWLPAPLRRVWAEKLQELAAHHWPRELWRRQPRLVAAIAASLGEHVPDARGLLEELRGPFRHEDYAGAVERVLADGLEDPRLAAVLARHTGAVLFTGGGLVRAGLLGLPGVRFIHVHPGHLPHVRGADGLLWSLLVRGRPGVSAFYMERGIDTGSVIAARELAPLSVALGAAERPDDLTLYRALFSFVDPLLRAELLVGELLAREDAAPDALPAREQDPRQGITYHFLHPALRAVALARLFPERA